ncbi:hypothetical protein SUGI_0220530 [Cryptomeria japonica]|nr:hypothetical protein SUGI_0220530 [Cryptomeria japonica]
MDSYKVTALLKRATETKDIHLGRLIHAFLIKTAYQCMPSSDANRRPPNTPNRWNREDRREVIIREDQREVTIREDQRENTLREDQRENTSPSELA